MIYYATSMELPLYFDHQFIITSSLHHSSPTSDGSAAAIVCSEEFVKTHGLEGQAVEIVAMEMATDLPSTFSEQSCIKMVQLAPFPPLLPPFLSFLCLPESRSLSHCSTLLYTYTSS